MNTNTNMNNNLNFQTLQEICLRKLNLCYFPFSESIANTFIVNIPLVRAEFEKKPRNVVLDGRFFVCVRVGPMFYDWKYVPFSFKNIVPKITASEDQVLLKWNDHEKPEIWCEITYINGDENNSKIRGKNVPLDSMVVDVVSVECSTIITFGSTIDLAFWARLTIDN